jgi:cytochrome c1
MKSSFPIFAIAILVFLFACNSDHSEKTLEVSSDAAEDVTFNPVERGGYLVNTNGCHDCHSPKVFSDKGMEVDPALILSGHPASEELPPYDEETARHYVLFSMGLTSATGPWGTSFAANLTPDETGIGTWTEDQFLTAIKKGLYKGLEGSRPLLPPMPWQHYKNFTDQDLKSIFAYLKSLDPVRNIVPEPIPPKGQN